MHRRLVSPNPGFEPIICLDPTVLDSIQQLGSLIILPLSVIFLLGETGTLAFDPYHLLVIAGILLLGDVGQRCCGKHLYLSGVLRQK